MAWCLLVYIYYVFSLCRHSEFSLKNHCCCGGSDITVANVRIGLISEYEFEVNHSLFDTIIRSRSWSFEQTTNVAQVGGAPLSVQKECESVLRSCEKTWEWTVYEIENAFSTVIEEKFLISSTGPRKPKMSPWSSESCFSKYKTSKNQKFWNNWQFLKINFVLIKKSLISCLVQKKTRKLFKFAKRVFQDVKGYPLTWPQYFFQEKTAQLLRKISSALKYQEISKEGTLKIRRTDSFSWKS